MYIHVGTSCIFLYVFLSKMITPDSSVSRNVFVFFTEILQMVPQFPEFYVLKLGCDGFMSFI